MAKAGDDIASRRAYRIKHLEKNIDASAEKLGGASAKKSRRRQRGGALSFGTGGSIAAEIRVWREGRNGIISNSEQKQRSEDERGDKSDGHRAS